ncbi:MAG: hypothetical protein AB7T09_16025 [Planctomycetota bacterium]
MSTFSCDTNVESDQREAPSLLSETFMVGRWTFHPYRRSYDGQTLIFHMHDGVKIQRDGKSAEWKMDLSQHNPRSFMFSPDNKSVAFWAPIEKNKPWKRIAIADVSGVSSNPRLKIVYTPPAGHQPFGIEWSPAGEAVFVVELVEINKLTYSILSRVDVPGGKVTELFRTLGEIDFFMPPVSRFENGKGPSKAPYKIIFGCENGLYLIDPKDGKKRQRLSALPATGLQNIEWNPDEKKNQIVLFFKNPASGADGRRFEGVYLVDLDKMEAARKGEGEVDQDAFMEQLHKKRDIHTLWFSPKGTYVTWASHDGIFFRKPTDPVEKTAVIEVLDKDGNPRKLKGVSWNDKEEKLVFTADSQVWVYDLDPKKLPAEEQKRREEEKKKKEEEAKKLAAEGKEPPKKEPTEEELIETITGKLPYRYKIAEFPKGFTAEPQWMGDRVVMGLFENAKAEIKKLREEPYLPPPEPEIMKKR